MTIKNAQETVDNWISQHGVRYFDIMTNMIVLTEEVGEMARVISRQYGEQSVKQGETLNLSDEIADVLWVLLCISNQTGIDLEKAFSDNLNKKTLRDSQRHLNNNKLK